MTGASSKRAEFAYHAVACEPRAFAGIAGRIATPTLLAPEGIGLYGIWRSQIGRPRDELGVITTGGASADATRIIGSVDGVRRVVTQPMDATLRPATAEPPTRQGNYAFRWFELAETHFAEFASLCEAAWPGFESAYDSQVIGLWRCRDEPAPGQARVLLLTRRPDLAMWERSKIPAGEAEARVRDQLSRRYDLCEATWVYTTTLLTAADRADEVRWA